MMNFDLSKENIQPLRAGRNVAQLEIGIQALTDTTALKELQNRQLLFENEIENYEGEDPLDLWYSYISWTEQAFPKQGHDGNLVKLLEKCLAQFENDARYAQDRRFCRLWIKYIDLNNKPLEIFQLMHSKNLCTQCADFYRAWAYSYEINGDFRLANMVIELGLKHFAQPYEELAIAHQNLMAAIVDSVLKRNTAENTRLEDERKALTSLHSFKQGKHYVVPTVRIGASILNQTPGFLPSTLPAASATATATATPITVYNDENQEHELLLNKVPNPNLSIIESVKNAGENQVKEVPLNKAGSWSNKKMKRIIQAASNKSPPFKVHEDDDQGANVPVTIPDSADVVDCDQDQDPDATIVSKDAKKNDETDDWFDRIRLPDNFVRFSEDVDLLVWKVKTCLPEPFDPNRKSVYSKERIYRNTTEFSFEENMADRWLRNRTADPANVVVDQLGKSDQSRPEIDGVREDNGPIELSTRTKPVYANGNESLTVHTKDVLNKFNECWNNNLSATITTGGIPTLPLTLVEESDEENAEATITEAVIVTAPQCPKATVAFEIHEDTFLGERKGVATAAAPLASSSQQDAVAVVETEPNQTTATSDMLPVAQKRKPLQVKEMSSSSVNGGGAVPPVVAFDIYEDICDEDPATAANRKRRADSNAVFVAKRKPLQVKEMSSSSATERLAGEAGTATATVPVTGNDQKSNFTVYRNTKTDEIDDSGIIANRTTNSDSPTETAPKPPTLIQPIGELTELVLSQPALRSQPQELEEQQPLPANTKKQFRKRESIITGTGKTKSCPASLDLDETCTMLDSRFHLLAASTPFNSQATRSRLQTATVTGQVTGPVIEDGDGDGDDDDGTASSDSAAGGTNTAVATTKDEQRLCQVRAFHATELATNRSTPFNPFSNAIRGRVLELLRLPDETYAGCYVKLYAFPRIARKETITIGDQHFFVEKSIGKGNFGNVHKAVHIERNEIVALKYQKPAHFWELYICKEVQRRLLNPNMRHAYMSIDCAYFTTNASIFVSAYSKFGSLLDVRNAVRKSTGKSLSEGVVLYFTSEILRIVEALHQTQIIHADIKPDNFLVMRLPPESGRLSLQLIDFGSSIDMALYPTGTEFFASVTTEDFICTEMREKRPWTFQTDYYCLAATVFCLLFDKYMQVHKQYDSWTLKAILPRYLKTQLWSDFFTQLLNVPNCQQMPNLRNLRESIENAQSSDDDLNNDFRYILNILKRR